MSDATATDRLPSLGLGNALPDLTWRRWLLITATVVLALIMPFVVRAIPYVRLSLLQQGLAFGLAALGLNVVLRKTRLVSFGHAAFFGGGAYGAAVATAKFGVESGLVMLLLGALVATLLAAVIGVLVLRSRGIYFSLLTLAFGQLLYALTLGLGYFNYSDGLPLRPDRSLQLPLLFGIRFEGVVYQAMLYWMTVVAVVVGLYLMWRINRSAYGRALSAIGQNRTRATFVGIRTRRYIWSAFVISGTYGGIAGVLYAMYRQQVTPDQFLFVFQSGDILFMTIIGGFQTLLGPIAGGIVLVLLRDIGISLTSYFHALIGAVLLLVVFGLPEGIVGSLKGDSGGFASVRERLEGWR